MPTRPGVATLEQVICKELDVSSEVLRRERYERWRSDGAMSEKKRQASRS
jgi:hypothetical protein